MITNCGLVTPKWYETNCPSIKPSITGAHIPYFHSLLCDWAYATSLSFFWVLVIDAQNINHLKNSITSVSSIEPTLKGKWDTNSNDLNKLFSENTQSTIGCIFADSVRVPGDGLTTESIGGSERNGHLKGTAASVRNTLDPLEIGFRETNLSFTDFFLRPWSIVTAYKGLISDNGDIQGGAPYWGGSIKSNIHLYQLAKGEGTCSSSVIRKQIHFYDAVPISVSNDDLTYEGSGGVNKRQISFAYNYYTVGSGNASL